MKNQTTAPSPSVNVLLKFLMNALKSIFQSGDDREFRRLKDFIAS
ncbi:MAG TPA: hypothetical protein PKY28_12125 [Ferruginibacter sp.]|nr:hypothetical protein [Ferruginibacter sp.]